MCALLLLLLLVLLLLFLGKVCVHMRVVLVYMVMGDGEAADSRRVVDDLDGYHHLCDYGEVVILEEGCALGRGFAGR